MTVPAPATVREAAVLVALEAAAALIAAVVFVVRAFAGADQHVVSGFGNAAWFGLIGAGLLAAARALWTGRRWGRGVAVFAQLLLLPVTWYIGVGSHQWLYAVPIAAVAVISLVLLFSPATLQWLTSYDSSANADNSGPDTR
ncbi:hypothetical protein [Candidatus Mycolicibacterium alkanivorans]|uniref:Integral membrane protein n=1 Tax=Candidatus Mycolicibacterium alkanivorans TaxID=2954114 RepID=A0ABS9Z2P0_9MYCO|nr:hypothetical protein [Candidatus Mycolicibacterium alkanivorans]MCI4676779.1 hypothetical protein [Candidatus Mycolicibacterium alkanivorans]